MGRATVIVPSVTAILLAVALALAPAAGSAPAADNGSYSASFHLRHGNFYIQLGGQSDEDTVSLSIIRGSQLALYETAGTFTPSSVEASFGRFGRLDLHFKRDPPIGKAEVRNSDGVFEGTVDFTGENGFVHLELHRIRGSLEVISARPSPQARQAAQPALPHLPIERPPEKEVHLEALDRSGVASGVFLSSVGVRTKAGIRTLSYAGSSERSEGVQILRGASAVAGPSAFEWHLATGRARVAPSAPFTGTAFFDRHRRRGARLSGSLKVKILGAPEPLRLTGRGFRTTLALRDPEPDE